MSRAYFCTGPRASKHLYSLACKSRFFPVFVWLSIPNHSCIFGLVTSGCLSWVKSAANRSEQFLSWRGGSFTSSSSAVSSGSCSLAEPTKSSSLSEAAPLRGDCRACFLLSPRLALFSPLPAFPASPDALLLPLVALVKGGMGSASGFWGLSHHQFDRKQHVEQQFDSVHFLQWQFERLHHVEWQFDTLQSL